MARIRQESLESLRAAFEHTDPLADAITGGTSGVIKGLDLADTLAQRKIKRTKDVMDIQKAVEEAKLAAQTRKQVNQFAELQDPNRSLSSMVPATFANVQGGEEQRQADITGLEGKLMPEELIKRRSEAAKGKAELAKTLQEQKGNQKLEQIRLEALLRPPAKDQKGINSFLLKTGSQAGATDAFIKDIEDKVGKMTTTTGVKGGYEALKGKIQQNAKGFLGGNQEIQAYEEARPSFGRRLYKQLSGDVGNISESEGKFATDLIPSAYETPDRRTAKIARLKELSAASQQAVADIVAKVRSGELDAKDAQALVKSTVLGIMQEAAAKPLPQGITPDTSMKQNAPAAPSAGARSFKVIATRPSK